MVECSLEDLIVNDNVRDARLVCGDSEVGDLSGAKEIGRFGEDVAAFYLEQTGFAIVERNWRCSFGEADIIATQEGDLALVEVKTRMVKGPDDVFPELGVNYRKRGKYRKLGLVYLSKQALVDRVRFDVIAVTLTGGPDVYVHHIIGAFESEM